MVDRFKADLQTDHHWKDRKDVKQDGADARVGCTEPVRGTRLYEETVQQGKTSNVQ